MIWRFAESFPPTRAGALLAPWEFEDISQRIAEEMVLLCCHHQTCDDNTRFARIVYCIRVSEEAFDLFYNSPFGYRGAYYRDPWEGVRANASLIVALIPKLTANAKKGATEQEKAFIYESLTSPSAKMWLAENGLGICPACDGEWGNPGDHTPEILNDRWEDGGPDSLLRGSKAPRLTKIRVFGAFLDECHNEFVPARKRHRARDIHLCGWS